MDLKDLNLQNPAVLGYYDPFSVYPTIKEDLDSKFPLTNLHWKYQASEPLQSIPLLPIDLVEEVPKHNVEAKNDNVYMRVMFVKYDNLDSYRSQVRPLIKEWLKKLLSRSHAEWMIVFYIPSVSKDRNSTLMKTSLFDKLKIDFGSEGKELANLGIVQEGRERCFKLRDNHENSIDKLEAYNVIISQFKILILQSFTNKYQLLSESLAKQSDATLEHFHYKLKLADLLSDMKLSQDSLNVFDELWEMLNSLKSTHAEAFDFSLDSIPSDLNGYHFESSQMEKCNDIVYGDFNRTHNFFELKCFVFINQSILLQSLANFAKTISISTIHISKLFRRLLVFLEDISLSYGDVLDEYIYVIIDNYLNLPICSKLVEINNKNNANNNTNVVLKAIFESRGELKLYQRSKLITIAASEGYQIEGVRTSFSNISLNDEEEATKRNKVWQYAPLSNALKDKESYFRAFEELTESAIMDLINSDRAKTVDILSVDLALLNYQKGNYKESLDILQGSHEFFLSNGWNFMGGFILDTYIDCIKRTTEDDHEQILNSYLKLLTTFAFKSENVGINEYRLIKPEDYIQSIFEEIKKYSSLLNHSFVYPLGKLFSFDKDISVEHDTSTSLNKAMINLKLTNLLGTSMKFKRITVELGNASGKSIPFELENVFLGVHDQILKLKTNHLIEGFYKLSSIQLEINENLRLVDLYDNHDRFKNTETDETVVKNNPNSFLVDSTMQTSMLNDESSNFKRTHYYQDFTKLWCDFSRPYDIELGFTEILFSIHNGNSDVQDLKMEFSSSTSGLSFDIEKSLLEIPELSANELFDLKIPYRYFGNLTTLNFAVTFTYISQGETFHHGVERSVDTSLTISVSVQDIFNSSFLFSKFQIGPAISRSPIKVTTVDLFSSNKQFHIGKPAHTPHNLILFDDQFASFVFKLTPEPSYDIKASDVSDLEIGYIDLREQCQSYLDSICLEKLSTINCLHTWLLFRPLIKDNVNFDLEKYVMNNSIQILNKEEIMEQLIELVVEVTKDTDVRSSIKEAFSVALNSVNSGVTSSEVLKKLHIEVPIPILDFLHSVEFKYLKNSHFAVGNPITMQLEVNVLRRWSARNEGDAANKSDLTVLAESSPNNSVLVTPPTSVSFQISIQNDDNWLLSGFRKYVYSLDEQEDEKKLSFEVTLIPLNVGKLVLPKVNIKSLKSNSDLPAMDMVVSNGSETVLVVPEIESITFSF